ncbi:MAG TPA: PEP-CTERM sorting domain-containing protein [Vicinamibacterales bacterium]|nr:PEP-CTERM sorting domain-containing protein [Vicinamibacterales bacterium]
MKRIIVIAVLATIIGVSSALAAPITISGTGANAAAITAFRDQFRTLLGGGNVAGANGLFSDITGARREINWDGVPQQFSAPNNLPLNFFNVNSPRGAVFATPGTGVQVSGATTDAGAGQPVLQFANIDATYPGVFEPFSAQRLFTAIGSNIVDVTFFVPGTGTPALTRGFGSIFSDVDKANTTSIEFFNAANASLGIFFVPQLIGSETFSFLGRAFDSPVVSRVRIVNGNIALGAGVTDQNGDLRDVVVMDDFLYAEPVAAPEPATLALTGLGLLAVVRYRRGRSRANEQL